MPLIAMIQEREPLQAADVPAMLDSWVQDVGGFAAVGLAIWSLVWLLRRYVGLLATQPGSSSAEPRPSWFKRIFIICLGGAALAYALYGVGLILPPPESSEDGSWSRQQLALTAGGLLAILAVCLPFAVDLTRLRPRRIWGLAWLSIREGRHRWVFWIIGPFVLLFLVAPWFLPHKPETQLAAYVQVIYWAMTPLLLLTAALLAAFSIPNDLRNHTIATIVTKPVERFEIVLGRFLGYVVLLSVILAAMTGCGLVFVWAYGVPAGNDGPGMRARVPLYGVLHLQGKEASFQGVPAGREWEYRRYIAGHPQSSHRAVWAFTALPTRLDERATVPCEFTFDIYRVRKPEKENDPVYCTFTFVRLPWSPERQSEFERERDAARRRSPAPAKYAVELDRLAAEYGIFEVPFKGVVDNRVLTIDVPVGLFKNAQPRSGDPERVGDRPVPRIAVSVKCETAGQLLGVAKYDLYFVDGEGYFAFNFIKGALGL
jgi:hypothetical protein